MQQFDNSKGSIVMLALCETVINNKAYLSEVDGKIGDGDHGINMSKGFSMLKNTLDKAENVTLSQGFNTLSTILLTAIGGSMGPLYGSFFAGMGESIKDSTQIDASTFYQMLTAGQASLADISEAEVGDKTMMDSLIPGIKAFQTALENQRPFSVSLKAMADAAQKGCESTQCMVAKVGRASRLGKRSVGVIDAGALSCALLLTSLSNSASLLLYEPINS